MSKTNLSDLLRGCEVGRVQSVGAMSVIPLISRTEDTRFVPPNGLKVSSPNYGTLTFSNPEPQVAIVPQGIVYEKTGAQAHTLPHVGLIKGRARQANYHTAACVQQRQGGHFQTMEAGEIHLMPLLLRVKAFLSRKEGSFGKLWDSIRSFNRVARLPDEGHVEHFAKHYAKQLDEFVAEFEPVKNQIGAIVIVNGRLAGVERAPNYAFWQKMWRPVIRDCYGGLAIYLREQGQVAVSSPTHLSLSADGLSTISDLRQRYTIVTQREEEGVKSLVRGLLAEPVERSVASNENGMEVADLESQHFVGQMVSEGLETIYATLMATEARLSMKNAGVAFSI